MLTCLVVCTACSQKTVIGTNKTEVEPIEENGATTEEGTQEESVQKESAETTSEEPTLEEKETTGEELTLTGKELESRESMEAYEKFMKDEAKVSLYPK